MNSTDNNLGGAGSSSQRSRPSMLLIVGMMCELLNMSPKHCIHPLLLKELCGS